MPDQTRSFRHVFEANYRPGDGWDRGTVRSSGMIGFQPSSLCLHYGQQALEGLSGNVRANGELSLFHPSAHLLRLNRTLHRLAMPSLPEALFLGGLAQLCASETHSVAMDSGSAAYFHVVVLAVDDTLFIHPSAAFRLLIVAERRPTVRHPHQAIEVRVERQDHRGMPGGLGDVKCGASLAAGLAATMRAQRCGAAQPLWLDAVTSSLVEGVGAMNLFAVHLSGSSIRFVTPALTGAIVPGITRDTVIGELRNRDIPVDERDVPLEELDSVAEVFGCSTNSGIVPITGLVDGTHRAPIGSGIVGAATRMVAELLYTARAASSGHDRESAESEEVGVGSSSLDERDWTAHR